MARIGVVCPFCGDIKVAHKEVVVMVCRNNSEGSYSLACPLCSKLIHRRAEPRIIELLIESGCRLNAWSLPTELTDKQRSVGKPPIDDDELIDFHEGVQDESVFAEAFHQLCRETK